jgi:hypothetical protein
MRSRNLVLIPLVLIVMFSVSSMRAEVKAGTEILWVDAFDDTDTAWAETGVSPYLNDSDSNYVSSSSDGADQGVWDFNNSDRTDSVDSVYLWIEIQGPSARNDQVDVSLYNTSAWYVVAQIDSDADAYEWIQVDLSSYVSSWSAINGSRLRIEYDRVGSPATQTIYVRRAYLNVTYSIVGVQYPPENVEFYLTNLDDGNNLYAERKEYELFYSGRDNNSYADIRQVQITSFFGMSFDEDTDTFVRLFGTFYLNESSSSFIKSGVWLNITFRFFHQLNGPELSGLDFRARIYNSTNDLTDDDTIFNVADSVSTLLTDSIECTDVDDPDRVDVDSSQTVNFGIRYADNPGSGTPSTFYPPEKRFVNVTVYDANDNPMSTDYSIINGDGSVTFSESVIKIEDYYLGLFFNSTDTLGGSQYFERTLVNLNESIIWDRIEIFWNANTTSPGALEDVNFTLALIRYDYDDVSLSSFTYDIIRNGSLWVNDYTFNNFTDGGYEGVIYNYTLGDWTESNYGLTVFYLNVTTFNITWGSIAYPVTPDLFFGAGFNGSINGYVLLYWNHSLVDVTNFEIQNSTDGISFTFLDSVPTEAYNHSPVGNMTYNYYRVRARNLVGSDYYNSSWSATNLERVFFETTGAGPGPGAVTVEREYPWVALSILFSICAYLIGSEIKQ